MQKYISVSWTEQDYLHATSCNILSVFPYYKINTMGGINSDASTILKYKNGADVALN